MAPATPAVAVLWQEQVALPPIAAEPLPSRVHTVVVGAGYAGLAAARTLARAGRTVLVLEKGSLGWGAHARNGGMAIPELKHGPATLLRRYGELGGRLHAEVNEAFDDAGRHPGDTRQLSAGQGLGGGLQHFQAGRCRAFERDPGGGPKAAFRFGLRCAQAPQGNGQGLSRHIHSVAGGPLHELQ